MLNRHELVRYRRQRKWDLLTQLVLIIAFYASLSPIIRAEEMFGNHTDIQTVPECQLYDSCGGSVWFGLACV